MRRIQLVSTTTASLLVVLAACESTGAHEIDQQQTPEVAPPAAPPPGETFEQLKARLEAEKPAVMAMQQALLEARYDLSDKPGAVTMTRGKPVQRMAP